MIAIRAAPPTEGTRLAKCYFWWYYVTGKIRRGGYVFFTWKGDHPPRHVHVYRDGRLIVKWDLEERDAEKEGLL